MPSDPPAAAHRLVLPERIDRQLRLLVETGYPEEVCGVLLGGHSPGETRPVAVRQIENLNRARARDRFEMDPEGFLAADGEARRRGLEIVGVWHSHPDHPARPSATDLAAAWEGWSYVIVAVTAAGAGELRSWRLAGDRFVEESVTLEEGVQP